MFEDKNLDHIDRLLKAQGKQSKKISFEDSQQFNALFDDLIEEYQEEAADLDNHDAADDHHKSKTTSTSIVKTTEDKRKENFQKTMLDNAARSNLFNRGDYKGLDDLDH